MNNYHTSVLLQESVSMLRIQPGANYIDATLGGGGHSRVILQKGGFVLGIDADQDAIAFSRNALRIYLENHHLIIHQGNFSNILGIAKQHEFNNVAGILYDLGVSSHLLDDPERGFSFQAEAPLDMRMDKSLNVKAADLLNILTKGELYELFHTLGEERFSRSIAERIVSTRRVTPITTTTQLSQIISESVPRRAGGVHPATRVFQALRIAVNDELNRLRESLPQAYRLLNEHGRITVISFHSLEDRIVKNQFKDWKKRGMGVEVTKKPLTPGRDEVLLNNRSRSAKLRGFEKI